VVVSAREAAELERKLRQELRAERPTDPRELHAAARRLRSMADALRSLRVRVASDGAYATAERRASLAERIVEEREKEAERKAQEPTRRAIGIVRSFADQELIGRAFDPSRLSPAEGEALLELVNERADGTLSGRKRRRYETLVETLADCPGLFAQARREQEAEARQQAEQARAMIDRGPVALPALLGEWLFDPRPETLTTSDLGLLAAVLYALDRGVSCFARSEISGERIVLDPSGSIQLHPSMDGSGGASCRDSIRYLADLELLELGTEEGTGRTTIGRGERIRQGVATERVT
jgi:hypothetical protein